MSDDQVGCEWVSVSSGTYPTLPGLSRTKAVKRLCVCVCVCGMSVMSCNKDRHLKLQCILNEKCLVQYSFDMFH